MAIQQIPIPSEGQALDVSYLGAMVQTINSLVEQFGDLSSISSVISDVTGDNKTVLTQMLNITSKTFKVAAETTSVAWQFNKPFKFPPVIVLSVEGSTDTVYIERSGVANASIRFAGSGKATVQCNVHAIAIGLLEGT